MNCPKCNAPVGPNDAFCLNCGEKVTPPATQYASAYADPASYAAPAGAGYAAPTPAKKASPLDAITGLLKSNDGKMNKLIPIAAIAVVALVLVIIISSIAGGPKSVAKSYLKATADGDVYKSTNYSVFDNSVMKKGYKNLAEEEGLSEKEYYEDKAAEINELDEDDEEEDATFDSYKSWMKYRSESTKEAREEALSEKFGSDYKIKVKILDVEKCTKSQSNDFIDELDESIEYFEDAFETKLKFDSDDAKQFKKVTYSVTIEGSEDTWESEEELEDDLEMILVKIKGDWKVFESDGLGYYYY